MTKIQDTQSTLIGLKDFRENLPDYIKTIEGGHSYVVIKRSKPVFRISPVENDDEMWETVIDFTQLQRGGVNINEILKRL